MTVEHAVGDLFSSDLPAIGHGCNCAGRMGKGIAVEFKRRWPPMFDEYRRRCLEGEFGLGDILVWEANDRIVFNLGTQQTWRTRAQLWAIDASTRKMLDWAEAHSVRAVGLPRIGAGLGGREWSEVQRTFESAAGDSPVRLVVFASPPEREAESP